jgi:hypothetical protein
VSWQSLMTLTQSILPRPVWAKVPGEDFFWNAKSRAYP